jgi:Uri superfamily endonuclease
MEYGCIEPGIYTILLMHGIAEEIKVGSLGVIAFAAGYYAYTGSAQGSGGCKRVDRHIRVLQGIESTRRWHIDYLLPKADFLEVFITKTTSDLECRIASMIGERLKPVKGFGCTDCTCLSHLHYAEDLQNMQEAVRLAHGQQR